MVWNIKFIKYRENKLIVIRYVQNVGHRNEHKHARAFVIGQLHHHSSTASSRATHSVDAVDVVNSSLIHTLLNDRL